MRAGRLLFSTVVLAALVLLTATLLREKSNGVLSFSCVILPALVLAARGRAPLLVGMWAVGIAAMIAEATFTLGPSDQFPVNLLFVLIGLTGMVGCASYAVRRTETGDPGRARQRRSDEYSPALEGAARPMLSLPTRAMFLRLLETIDDIGRLMSMNYEVDMLLPAIVSTAESALDATQCEVYLWDAAQRSLVRTRSDAARRSDQFSPLASHNLCASIISDRRLWTRGRTGVGARRVPGVAQLEELPDAVAPLVAGTELLGVLVVGRVRSFSPQFEQLLHALANIYGLGIRNAQLFQRTQDLAQRDGLTGLYNHATFQQRLRALMLDAAATSTPLSLLMGDIDFFKRFNDDHGHQTGDDVLRQVSQLWTEILPHSAIVARYGGEEFIAALPRTDHTLAAELAERLRSKIESHVFQSASKELSVTSSFGVAEQRDPSQPSDELVRIVDECLYESKRSGRNRVTNALRPHCGNA